MPTRPPAPCGVLRCPHRRPCPVHPPQPRPPWTTVKPTRGTTAQRGYGFRHQQLRLKVLARDPLCIYRFDAGCTDVSTVADHVIRLADGGLDTLDNMVGCCRHCHAIKSGREAMES
jgi:5-methylcytosine-specific restriction enzyme A